MVTLVGGIERHHARGQIVVEIAVSAETDDIAERDVEGALAVRVTGGVRVAVAVDVAGWTRPIGRAGSVNRCGRSPEDAAR
jgi:hypothetical protein